MPETDWDAVAKKIIDSGEQSLAQQQLRGYSVLVEWRENFYVGSLQHIAPEYSDEVVLLSKPLQSIPLQLKEAIIRARPQITKVNGVAGLDLEGRLHIVRKVNDQLEIMTSDQLDYMRQKGIVVVETNTGEVISRTHAKTYRDGIKFNPESN